MVSRPVIGSTTAPATTLGLSISKRNCGSGLWGWRLGLWDQDGTRCRAQRTMIVMVPARPVFIGRPGCVRSTA